MIRALVLALPNAAFKSSGAGQRNAMLNALAVVDEKIAAGDLRQARRRLMHLRRRVNGCGASADRNDWVVACAAQVAIRSAIDDLLDALDSFAASVTASTRLDKDKDDD